MLVAGSWLAISSLNCCTRALCLQQVNFASKMLVTGSSRAIYPQQKLLAGTFLSTSVAREQVARYR